MNRPKSIALLLSMIAILAMVACSGGSDDNGGATTEPDSTEVSTGGQGPQSTGTKSPADPSNDSVVPNNPNSPPTTTSPGIDVGEPTPGFSPVSLPKRTIAFNANVPENTPDGDPVFLTIMDMAAGVQERFRMKDLGNGNFTVDAEVLDGATIRYTYDRFEYVDICCLDAETRESLGDSFRLQYRFLLTTPDVNEVNDTIPTWTDRRIPYVEGQISGHVYDSKTGEPVFDADVSISGVHVGTRVDGSFKVPRLPAGEHTVVVHSDTGDIISAQKVVTLAEGESTSVDFTVETTELVPVSFDVLLPNSTPDDAWVKLAGNVHALGGRIGHPARPLTPDNYFLPLLERDGNTASIELMLPAGVFVEYFYTIGPIGLSDEKVAPGSYVRRSFIVGANGDQRSDSVERWSNEGWPLVTLRLIPPMNTPEGTPIALNMGPSSWMEPREDGSYTTVLGTAPVGGTYNYQYYLGGDFNGADASDAADEGSRTLVVPEGGGEIVDVITHWSSQPDPAKRREDGSLSVKFRVSVPPETPTDAQITLHGNRPAIGDGVTMTQMPGNPWMYEVDVVFGHDGRLAYFFELGSGIETFAREVNTDFDGQVVNDWVVQWPGLSREVEVRDGFVKGVYTPDFYSNNFIALSEPTYNYARDHEASAIVVSSVWSYGQSQPTPTLEYRGVHAGTVSTPVEDALLQAKIAHDAGLDVFFGPQFNMEQAPGGFEVYNGPKTDEWWTEWLELAEEMWIWQATVGEMIEAEYMMLPGPLFHVWDYIDHPDDHPLIQQIDSDLSQLIAEVRNIYSGKIVITGSADRYSFPGLADYNGVTTYDVGLPSMPADSTVAEFLDYYEGRFAERVDPIEERWGNEVFFYTIHAPAMPTADDPSGEIGQANALEALFQAISKRPEITASLSWSYDMIDAPLHPGDGIRGRLGEAVLAKWYAILGGENS